MKELVEEFRARYRTRWQYFPDVAEAYEWCADELEARLKEHEEHEEESNMWHCLDPDCVCVEIRKTRVKEWLDNAIVDPPVLCTSAGCAACPIQGGCKDQRGRMLRPFWDRSIKRASNAVTECGMPVNREPGQSYDGRTLPWND